MSSTHLTVCQYSISLLFPSPVLDSEPLSCVCSLSCSLLSPAVRGTPSDGVPLFGYHRRSYLVLCGVMGAVAWAILALFVHDKYSTVACILLSSLSVAMSDVVSAPLSTSKLFHATFCWL